MVTKTLLLPEQSLTAPLPAKSGAQVITPEWLLNLPKQNADPPNIKWLNDTQVLYDVPSLVSEEESTVEVRDIHTGERQILGKGSHPTPSPDGNWIVCVRGHNEEKQLWLMDCHSNNLKQLSHVPEGLGEYIDFSFCFAWSPDSQKIALSHQPHQPRWEKKQPPQTILILIDRDTGQSQQIASFEASIHFLTWLPDGEELLFVKERIGFFYQEEEDHEWVQAFHLQKKTLRTLIEFDSLQQLLEPTASPDGQDIVLMYDADNPLFNFMPSLMLIPNNMAAPEATSSMTRLTHEMKLSSPCWARDGKSLYVRRIHGPYAQIYAIGIATRALTQITQASLNIKNYALSPDGEHLAWIGQDAQATRKICVAESGGHNARELIVMPSIPHNVALSEVREIEWQGPADYPVHLRGLLVMPLNYEEGTAYPFIVDIHGGGPGASLHLSGSILDTTPLEWQMWAAKGYGVFIPEFRSSASFGSLAIARDDLAEHNVIHCDIKDIETGIEALIIQGLVDSGRIATIGYSAGARRVNSILATSQRFRAAVSKEGWADEWIYFLNEAPSKRVFKMFGGAPWEVPQNYLKNSALFHCQKSTIPTLFLMGNAERGGADPHHTVRMLHNILKVQGVDTEYVQYTDEGHAFTQMVNQRDALERSIRWIDGHMKEP